MDRCILHDADSSAEVPRKGFAGLAEKLERSRAGAELGGHEAKQGALSGSVWAHHDHPVPGLPPEGDTS